MVCRVAKAEAVDKYKVIFKEPLHEALSVHLGDKYSDFALRIDTKGKSLIHNKGVGYIYNLITRDPVTIGYYDVELVGNVYYFDFKGDNLEQNEDEAGTI